MATKTKQSLTCSVCLELFSEPKVLPCCHTFCLKCLEKTSPSKASTPQSTKERGQTAKSEITCPHCRKTHAIPAGGLTEFLTDYTTAHEIEVKQLKSPATIGQKVVKGKTLPCGECEESPVESYCCDCQHYLCGDCLQVHKKFKSFRGHRAIPIQDLDMPTLQSSKTLYCSKHKGEALKLFCHTCQKLVCRDCILVDHRLHRYVFMQDARKLIEDTVTALNSAVAEKFKKYKANLGEIEKVETTAVGYSNILKAGINAFFDKLVLSIEARRSNY